MKTIILAGGLGSRLSEETAIKPKPMVEIGDMPILWHIMKIYSHYGFNDFIVCLGYKGYYIKEWFSHYYLHNSDITFDLKDNKIEYHINKGENWRVTLVDTGDKTLTGGRIKRVKSYIGNETFMMTYGDGVSDVDIKRLVEFHKDSENIATMTAVTPEGRFGTFDLADNQVTSFHEKKDNKDKINGGFFVLEPEVFDYIDSDMVYFEQEPLTNLARDGKLFAYIHQGFWKCMDTLKDRKDLEEMWQSKNCPWRIWEDNQYVSKGARSNEKDEQGFLKDDRSSFRW